MGGGGVGVCLLPKHLSVYLRVYVSGVSLASLFVYILAFSACLSACLTTVCLSACLITFEFLFNCNVLSQIPVVCTSLAAAPVDFFFACILQDQSKQ